MADESEPTPGAAEPAPPKTKKKKRDPLVGKVLADRFKIERLVAQGGMGKIYQATQSPLERIVALKTLHAGADSDADEFRTRFFNEAAICAKLTHPNTVRIFDYGATWDDVYFIAMEWLEGLPFHDVIKEQGPLHPMRVSHILRQMAGSLSEAHEQGIIHRDIKPANILLCKHGDDEDFAKVVDFGLVKQIDDDSQVTKAGTVLGSPMYMSPEQVEGTSDVDHRTDIYAMGVIMFVALTGKVPFQRKTSMAVMMSHMSAPVPTFAEINPDVEVPAAFEWITRCCMEKDRDDRFRSVKELAKALRLAEMQMRGELGDDHEWKLESGSLVLNTELAELFQTGSHPSGGGANLPNYLSSPTLNRPGAGQEGEGQSKVGLMVAVALAVLMVLGIVVGGGALLLGGGLLAGGGEDTVDPGPIVDVEPDPVPDVVVPEPVVHEMTLSSEPAGAEVSHDGMLLGNTPLPLSIPDGERWNLTMHSKGFEDREILVDGSRDLSVSLDKKAGAAKVPVAPVQPKDPVVEPETKKHSSDIRNPWDD